MHPSNYKSYANDRINRGVKSLPICQLFPWIAPLVQGDYLYRWTGYVICFSWNFAHNREIGVRRFRIALEKTTLSGLSSYALFSIYCAQLGLDWDDVAPTSPLVVKESLHSASNAPDPSPRQIEARDRAIKAFYKS